MWYLYKDIYVIQWSSQTQTDTRVTSHILVMCVISSFLILVVLIDTKLHIPVNSHMNV